MDNFKTSKLEKSSKIRKSIDRNVPYNVPGELIEVFEDFFESNFRAPSNEKGTTLFAILLNHRKVSSSDDFSDETFYIDFKMASSEFISFRGKSLTGQEKSMLKNLYSYLLSNYPDNFETLTLNVINHNNTFRLINENYKIVKRNIFDELPTDLDKWIYLDNENIYNIDFTLVEQEKMRNGLKSYFWYDTSSKTESKYQALHVLIKALNLLSDNFQNSQKNQNNENNQKLGVREITFLKEQITNGKKSQSAFIYISHIKSMLLYFEEINILKINKTALNLLKMNNVKSKPLTKYYSKDEMESILKCFNEKIQKEDNENIKVLTQLQLIATLYVLNTAMRLETVCNLKIGDLNHVDNNYFYVANGKNEEKVKYNISPGIKKLHDEVLKITAQYRNEAETLNSLKNSIGDYLFLYKRKRGNNLSLLNKRDLNYKIKEISNELGIEPLGITGVRNRFMNNIIYNINTGNNGAIIQALSKHSINVHYNHYFENNIKEIALQLYGVTIGEADLKGMVLEKPNIDVKKKDIVMNGRGYCSSDTCNENNVLDCLMCRYFRCTPANIPYFKNEIELLEKEISEEPISHEREFKIARKKLNVEYLFRCYEIQNGGLKNGTNEEHN